MTTLSLPEPGPLVPRRPAGAAQRVAAALLRWQGWSIDGDVPNVPKLVLCGVPHTSNWDGYFAMLAVLALRLRISIMIKASALRNPLGGLLRWVGFVGIDRKAPGSVVEETVRMMREAEAFWFCIAPEGTRHAAKDFKSGFYRIAVAAEVPIVMARIDYRHKRMTFTPPLQPSGDWPTDRRLLLERIGRVHARNPERLSAAIREVQ